MKPIIMLLLSLVISNIAFAEIITEKNEFDNSQIIASVITTKDAEYNETVPRELIFKKLTHAPSAYSLTITNQYTAKNRYSEIEPIKIKFNNSLDDVYYADCIWSSTSQRTQLTCVIDNNIIPYLFKTETVQIQAPLYSSYKTHVKYTEFTVPEAVLNEWKQVITME